eukprot:gnl/TRDRNA2_/TRDRNA2_186121_c0_seq1.p1 gnl/TRDRNA2_/TRDRNA2_186121_c0~~gnl/TRDRNA2_/TRDRNA2_186121_c0_seq1.p1  ORF type:complete len:172 (-),score=0.92 gnl/TRDRNA2_/TRDRNA2_186121_c0_seq1:25-540(-)
MPLQSWRPLLRPRMWLIEKGTSSSVVTNICGDVVTSGHPATTNARLEVWGIFQRCDLQRGLEVTLSYFIRSLGLSLQVSHSCSYPMGNKSWCRKRIHVVMDFTTECAPGRVTAHMHEVVAPLDATAGSISTLHRSQSARDAVSLGLCCLWMPPLAESAIFIKLTADSHPCF